MNAVTTEERRTKNETTVEQEPGLILRLEGDKLELNHALLEDAFGPQSHGFVNGMMSQIVRMAVLNGRTDPVALDFIGGALLEMRPQNGVEAILVVQTIANHLLAMTLASKAIAAPNAEQTAKFEAMFTKVARTTTAQAEALHKLRHGGKQNVTVKHIHIHEGGQAIVGNVRHGGRGE